MKEQLTPLYDVFLVPKETFLKLPSNRLYPVVLAILLLSSIIPVFRSDVHKFLLEKLGGNLQIILLVGVITLIAIPIKAWILQQIASMCGIKLTLRKIINISGYARMPGFIVTIVSTVLLWLSPTLLEDRSNAITLSIFGLCAGAFSLFLLIYGIAVCPSEENA